MRHRLHSAAPLALALAVAALAGCGGSSSSGNGVASKSPTEILAAARTAADGASAVHVSGRTVTGGTPIALDLSLVAGKGGMGRIAQNGLSFELVALEGTIYIKGSPAFYKHFAGAAGAQLRGKWLKAPATNASFGGVSSLIELHKLLDAALVSGDRALVNTGTSTVKGQTVVGVKDRARGETIYVATTGKPYPVAATKRGAGGGTIAFAEWDRPVTLSAPANAVDIEQLQQGH